MGRVEEDVLEASQPLRRRGFGFSNFESVN
jgi:hypothetical protein